MPKTPYGELRLLKDSLRAAIKSNAATCAKDNVFLELGVFKGYTSRRIAEILIEEGKAGRLRFPARLIGVDAWSPSKHWWNHRLGRLGSTNHYNREFFTGTTRAFFKVIEKRFSVSRAVWVFIDACHCRECAAWDIEHFGNLVLPGGLLVLHDTQKGRRKIGLLGEHGGTRPLGVHEVLDAGALNADRGWTKVDEVDFGCGLGVWRRTP